MSHSHDRHFRVLQLRIVSFLFSAGPHAAAPVSQGEPDQWQPHPDWWPSNNPQDDNYRDPTASSSSSAPCAVPIPLELPIAGDGCTGSRRRADSRRRGYLSSDRYRHAQALLADRGDGGCAATEHYSPSSLTTISPLSELCPPTSADPPPPKKRRLTKKQKPPPAYE